MNLVRYWENDIFILELESKLECIRAYYLHWSELITISTVILYVPREADLFGIASPYLLRNDLSWSLLFS